MLRLALLATLVLAGCHADPAAPDASGEQVPVRSVAMVSAPEAPVVLDVQGLRVTSEGSVQLLAFGGDMNQSLETLTAVLGAPTDQDMMPDCGARPVTVASWGAGSLTVYAIDGKFQGWEINGTDTFKTVEGIGIGSMRASLDAAYRPTVDASESGVSFVSTDDEGALKDRRDVGYAGELDGQSFISTVTSLRAGASCGC